MVLKSPRQLRRAITLSILLAIFLSGCATHADFVDLRQEIRAAGKSSKESQTELRNQFEDLEFRIQALEAVRGKQVVPTASKEQLKGELEGIKADLLRLEQRIAQLETAQPEKVSAPAPLFPDTGMNPVQPEPEPSPLPVPPPKRSSNLFPKVPGMSPTSAFNLAYNDYLNGKYDLAIIGFQQYLQDFSDTSLAPNAYYWLGESYFQKADFVRAIKAFEHVVHEYPDHGKVPASLYKIGISAEETGDSMRARSNLTRVIEEFSTTNEANLAKNKLAEIR